MPSKSPKRYPVRFLLKPFHQKMLIYSIDFHLDLVVCKRIHDLVDPAWKPLGKAFYLEACFVFVCDLAYVLA